MTNINNIMRLNILRNSVQLVKKFKHFIWSSDSSLMLWEDDVSGSNCNAHTFILALVTLLTNIEITTIIQKV